MILMDRSHALNFQLIKNQVPLATNNTYYRPTLEARSKWDTSRSGLLAALERKILDG